MVWRDMAHPKGFFFSVEMLDVCFDMIESFWVESGVDTS